jgi:tetratricopeptide (TPR) repeat protein
MTKAQMTEKSVTQEPQIQKKILQAIKKHQENEFQEAKEIYNEIIEAFPNHVQAIYFSGLLSYQQDVFHEAKELISKALELNPSWPEALNNRGNANKSLGYYKEALNDYTKAIEIDPCYALALSNRGLILSDLNCFRAAIADLTKAIEIQPDDAGTYYKRGLIFAKQEFYKNAICDFDRALIYRPDDVDTLKARGNTYRKSKSLKNALMDFNRIVILRPNCSESFLNRGAVFSESEEFYRAIDDYNTALSLDPLNTGALNNRASAYEALCHFAAALFDYNRAIALKPDFAEAYNNRGITFGYLKKFKQSFKDFDKAISLKPDYAEAHTNKFSHYILNFNFNLSWPFYEWRWRNKNQSTNFLDSSKPLWGGETGKRVFLWAEQGVGDEIMFSSMLKEVYAASSQLIVQCDQRLIPLFKRSFNDDIIYNHNRDEISEDAYDFHIPMGSLPGIFRPSLKSFKKGSQPFLRFELKKANSLRQKILNDPEEKLIGISWKSKSILPGSLKRNISLNDIVHYINMPKTKLLSLQYGDVSKEIMQLKKETGIDVIQIDEIDNYADIDGLAAIIGACDQVVSIDNATVHLAGALGADTRVLLPYNRDWRWGVSGTTSYWYDSIRLYRQNEPNDWETTLKILREELTAEPASNASALSKAMV